jgi:hypothetical protein
MLDAQPLRAGEELTDIDARNLIVRIQLKVNAEAATVAGVVKRIYSRCWIGFPLDIKSKSRVVQNFLGALKRVADLEVLCHDRVKQRFCGGIQFALLPEGFCYRVIEIGDTTDGYDREPENNADKNGEGYARN